MQQGRGTSTASSSVLGILEHLPTLLGGFAAFDNTELDPAIDRVLRRLGSVTGVDRTYVFRLRELGDATRVLDNTHEWCAPGIEPQIDELQQVPEATIEPWLPAFRAGRAVHLPRVADLHPDRVDRQILEPQGIRSLLAVPLIGANQLLGFLGFDAVRGERSFSAEEQLLLRAVADAICSALLRREAVTALSERERRYRLLAEHSSDLVATVADDGAFRDLAPSAAALLGWTLEALADSRPLEHVHPDDRSAMLEAMRAATEHPGTGWRLPDTRLRHHDGSWRWMQLTAIDLRHDPGVDGTVVIGHDITERKLAEAALAHQALHDPLTGLANRTLLLDRLQQALDRAKRHERTVAVLFLDLDRFKVVNDSLGHARGDDLLRAFAARLMAHVRACDTVARFGGDEFVVVLDEVSDRDDAHDIASRLLTTLAEPFDVDGRPYRMTSSAGLVMARDDLSAGVLLRDADTAMYQAKARGRKRITMLDDNVRRVLLEEADLARELQGIDERGELTVEYQPVFSLADGSCVGYEALARWDHPVRGRIAPGRFVPLAEEHGVIGVIGASVLTQAVTQLLDWDARIADHTSRTMAVNLSVRQLVEDGLIEQIEHLLGSTGIDPARLQLELTESVLMAEPAASRRVLNELRELGIGVAIDDFGTGYSSLAYLRELPVTTLKVDRSFVTDLGHDERGDKVVAVVLTLAREFGLHSVGEGIETEEQRRELARLGCLDGQGYGLARPAPPAELETQTFMPIARSSSRT